MMFLVAIMFATLAIIYGTTKIQTTKESKEMLQIFADSYDINGFPDASQLAPLNLDEAPIATPST